MQLPDYDRFMLSQAQSVCVLGVAVWAVRQGISTDRPPNSKLTPLPLRFGGWGFEIFLFLSAFEVHNGDSEPPILTLGLNGPFPDLRFTFRDPPKRVGCQGGSEI